MENEVKEEKKRDSDICPRCGNRKMYFFGYDEAHDLIHRICEVCDYTDWCDYYGNPYPGDKKSKKNRRK